MVQLIIEQTLNGIQLGVMLFLISAGLSLVFGIMNFINLAHGAFFMVGAYLAAALTKETGSFVLSALIAVPATAVVGLITERFLLRRFYGRDHLDQVLVTFGLIFVFNDMVRYVWGVAAVPLPLPPSLAGSVEIYPGLSYPVFRIAILLIGLLVTLLLYVLIVHTRAGMWVRAGASDRTMASAMGVNVSKLFSLVFAFGAALAGLAGIMTGPLTAVLVGMGDSVVILALVVTVLGGIGSIRGAFVAALLVGTIDTFGRVLLPAALGNVCIFVLMAAILAWKPKGLFPAHG
jgi:branched-chain amino acid transport system permease protein